MRKRIQFVSIISVTGTRYDDDDLSKIDYNAFFTPLAVGLLHAYLNSDPEIIDKYEIKENYIFENKKIEEYYQDIDYSCDIFCFSNYMWNQKRHIKIAKEIKEKKPSAIIIFGGQSIQINPDSYTLDFLKKNNHIDILVHGQGEIILSEILKNIDNLENINNISFIKNNKIITNKIVKMKSTDLRKEVSPYYPNFLFEHIKKYSDDNNKILTYLIETNKGCPFECTFCEWGKYIGNSLVKLNDLDFIKKEIEVIVKNMDPKKYSKGIFVIDSNFGILKRDVEILKEIILNKKKYGIDNLFFSKCDSKIITEHSLEIENIIQKEKISSHKILALQTSDLQTLKNIKRPYIDKTKMLDIRKKSKNVITDRIKGGIKNGIEFIFSLPGGYSYELYLKDLDHLITTSPYGYYQSYICFAGINTEIMDVEYSKQWGIQTEVFPIFDTENNVESARCIVKTNAFSRQDFAKMFKLNILWKLIKNDKPFNILSNVIIYLHKNNIISFSNFMEKFYDFIVNNKTYIYKKNRNIFKYIDMLSEGYYTSHEDRKIKRKFFAMIAIQDFNSYVDNIIDFLKSEIKDDLLIKKILKILKITIMFRRIKGKIILETAGWEAYGMHGIYYSKIININLKKIMKRKLTKHDIFKTFT